MTIRIDKLLANHGYCSRRKVAEFLKAHDVIYNGSQIVESGQRVEDISKLSIDGDPIKTEELVYFLVNKPVGYVTTASDEHNRQTVLDLLPTSITEKYRLYPVGRLDQDSSGLVLLTNDGDLAYKLTHPKFHVPKTYRVTVIGKVNSKILNRLRSGIPLKDGKTSPAEVELISKDRSETILEITIHEGRNRQVRRMCKAINLEVISLERIAIGNLNLETLSKNQYKQIIKTSII